MTAILQPYQRVFGTDGHAYMKTRGRKVVPYTPDVPALIKRSTISGISAMTNGVGGPPDPPDPGGLEDRDTLLKPFYGKLGAVGSPYARTGPTKNQVGPRLPYSQLVEFNPASTQNLSITSPVSWDRKIIHGRITVSGAGQITATDCVFDGPADPTASFISGETAIIDFNSVGSGTFSVLKDCTIYARVPNPRLNATKGGRHRLERCHMFWTTDGVGPYTTPGQTWATKFDMVACRIEDLVYWPGPYYADRAPNYWNGTTYAAIGTSTIARSAGDGKVTGQYDNGHNDGNHTDCMEIHNGFGTNTYNAGTDTWTGDGIHVWGNAMLCNDAYGQANPSNIPVSPLPKLGRGDSPSRGLPSGGQKPGVNSYTTWEKPIIGTNPVQYSARGVSVYIGHVTGVFFQGPTTVVVHNNYINYGNMGMQEQKKALAFIQFHFYDNIFGPDYYCWATSNDRDNYPVRINDYPSGSNLSVSGSVITHSGNLLYNTAYLTVTSIGNSTAGLLTGITSGSRYYVVNRTSTTFQLSLTSGGAPISIGGSTTAFSYSMANLFPNFTLGPVKIANHPANGSPPFGAGGNNVFYDPNNKLGGRNGQPLGLGSSSVPGLRVI